MPDPLDDRQLRRYLQLLGIAPRPPSREALGALARAHVERVPFESLSKLWRFRRQGLVAIPPLEEFLDGVERLGLGGTCYAIAAHLNGLLCALGYRARLHGADMSRPDVHVVNVVELDGRPLLVDAGYGAPFREPLPLDATAEVEVEAARSSGGRSPGARSSPKPSRRSSACRGR